jgi:FlgD Ig-like domain
VKRLPVAAFITLAVATIGAFFVVQHLKVTTPLLTGAPAPYPADINPVDGKVCLHRNHLGQLVPLSFKRMSISFYLLHRADNVDVYIIDANGNIVRELPGSGVYMRVKHRHVFVWDGRQDDGAIVPDGRYYIRVALVHQGRDVEISDSAGHPEPVTVITVPPRPRVTAVSPSMLTYGANADVTISYTGNEGRRPRILLYRVQTAGAPRLVKSFAATSLTGHSVWNGQIGGAPAPRGVYLVALQVTDRACNTGSFPASLPPTLESASHAEITVS